MRRKDKIKNIKLVNERLNQKKNSIAENFYKPGEGSDRKYFDYILQGEASTEEDAYERARGMDWGSMETQTMKLPHVEYVDTVNGVEIYHDNGGDYYVFAPAELKENETPSETECDTLDESKKDDVKLINEGTYTMFEKLCNLKIKNK